MGKRILNLKKAYLSRRLFALFTFYFNNLDSCQSAERSYTEEYLSQDLYIIKREGFTLLFFKFNCILIFLELKAYDLYYYCH